MEYEDFLAAIMHAANHDPDTALQLLRSLSSDKTSDFTNQAIDASPGASWDSPNMVAHGGFSGGTPHQFDPRTAEGKIGPLLSKLDGYQNSPILNPEPSIQDILNISRKGRK